MKNPALALLNGEALIPPRAGSWMVLALLTIPTPFYLTIVFMLGPLLPQLALEFDTSVAIAGQLAAASFLA